MNKKAFLIFSGSNPRAVISFCRLLQANQLPIYIIARTNEDLIFKSSYRNNVVAVRKTNKLEKKDLLRCIQKSKNETGCDYFVIPPISEFLNQYLLDNREFFEELNCKIPLVDKKLYDLISNKKSSKELCKTHRINTPTEISTISKDSLPFVAKPTYNINPQGKSLYPHLLLDSDSLSFFKSKENLEDYYFEEYVYGESYYLLFYFCCNGNVIKFSQQNLMQQACGKSMLLARPAQIHKKSIADQFVHLLNDIEYHGFAMIDLILNEKTSEYTFIEINPRFWGPFQLTIDANTNIINSFINEYIFDESKEYIESSSQSKRVNYFWLGGYFENLINHKQVKYYPNVNISPLNLIRYLLGDVYFRKDTLGIFWYELYSAIKQKNKEDIYAG